MGIDISIGISICIVLYSDIQKLTGTDRQTGRQAGKPMCWEAAPPKIQILYTVTVDRQIILILFKKKYFL